MIATAALLLPLKSQGQLGALGNAGGTVTPESLNADLFGGLEFFAKANIKFAAAVLPAENAAKIKASLDAAIATKDAKQAQAADKETREEIKAGIEQLIKEKKELTEQQKQLIKEGQKEAVKGVAKWAAVGVSLAMAAKSGNSDAQLATAIPAAQQMIQDLPAIKNMLGTFNELNKAKK